VQCHQFTRDGTTANRRTEYRFPKKAKRRGATTLGVLFWGANNDFSIHVTFEIRTIIDRTAYFLIVMTDANTTWKILVDWIRREGGLVHEGLTLKDVSPGNRGIFATRAIPEGETLIRLPSHLSIDGRSMPVEYDSTIDGNTKRTASPWLRCLGAYYKAQRGGNNKWTAYLQSLPTSYETVAAWEEAEIEAFLAGTSTQGGSSVAWHNDVRFVRERYMTQIRSYLQQACPHADIFLENNNPTSDTELEQFKNASACLSTRSFHLEAASDVEAATVGVAEMKNKDAKPASSNICNDDGDDDDKEATYTGPFLLPAIDLLNHAASNEPGHCTTLRRDTDCSFCMKAERPITANQEILHSYGDHLTASQYLQTFGFVPTSRTQAIVNDDKPEEFRNLTPALLRKQDVLETCWSVIASGLPTRLAEAMTEMEDEAWTVKVDRRRTADFISDDLIVDVTTPLTDEIVTTACLAFFPICAYREAAQALLSAEILDDFFLGTLVCTSLLQVLHSKLEQYRPITWEGTVHEDDARLLRQLLSTSTVEGGSISLSQQRLMYGLTLRLEEKTCLHALRRDVVETLSRLEEDLPEEMQATKKQKFND